MTYTIEGKGVEYNKRIVFGTFTMGAGDSSGVITTGLVSVDFAMASNKTTAANTPKVERNTTNPGQVKITVPTNGDDGYWLAIGH